MHGGDQRSAALEVYESCRRILTSELGLVPAIETVTLAEQIRGLAQVESHSKQNDLPPVLTRFFGRQRESARLVDLLSRRTVRLVTLTGTGGVDRRSVERAEHLSYTAGMAKGKQLLAINRVYTTGESEAAIQYELSIIVL